jgi:hypothetical protein
MDCWYKRNIEVLLVGTKGIQKYCSVVPEETQKYRLVEQEEKHSIAIGRTRGNTDVNLMVQEKAQKYNLVVQ